MAQITHHIVRQYPVIVESDETGGYVAECPAFEGCFSQGETVDEALQNIKEVIEMCREETEAEFTPLPARQIGIHLVTV
jgi:predicted RNase H-like HicB family nuclease